MKFIQIGILFVFLLACESSGKADSFKLQNGSWGGNYMNLKVQDNQVTIELPCAFIEISGAIFINSSNTFSQTGLYTFTPGIMPNDAKIEDYQQNVKINGKKEGDVLFIWIEYLKESRVSDAYTLTENRVENLMKCQ
jgi:hypothetical protein